MKRIVGRLFRRPLVQGDPNLVTGNELLVEQEGGGITISERSSSGEMRTITGGSDSGVIYNKFQVVVVGYTPGGSFGGYYVRQVIDVDGSKGSQTFEFLPQELDLSYEYFIGPFGGCKVGDRAPSDIGDLFKGEVSMHVYVLYKDSEQEQGMLWYYKVNSLELGKSVFKLVIRNQEAGMPLNAGITTSYPFDDDTIDRLGKLQFAYLEK